MLYVKENKKLNFLSDLKIIVTFCGSQKDTFLNVLLGYIHKNVFSILKKQKDNACLFLYTI